MKKGPKKLILHRDTLCSLDNLQSAVGQGIKTVDGTYCVSNCPACNFTPGSNCC